MTETKKLIGILGHHHAGRNQPGYGQNVEYIRYFRQFGEVIIIDAQCEIVLPLDLLVLPGGRDVNPMNYGQKPGIYTQSPDLEYEWFMCNMFPKYVERVQEEKMGVYGICAGFQNLVSYFGGTISQHIDQTQSGAERGKLVDNLEFNKDIPLVKSLTEHHKFRKDFTMTNSVHHQGCFPSDLPDCIDILATNKMYNNVEFIQHNTLNIMAEQSHPEERVNPLFTNDLILTILEKC